MKLFLNGNRETLKPFDNYRLAALQPTIRALFIIAALFNMLLLVPDIINIAGERAMSVGVLRVAYTLMVLGCYIWMKRMKSFRAYAVMAAVLEGTSLAVFIAVYTLYPTPDFSIQVLGMMVIIMFIYLTPGRWVYMNIVAVAGIAVFMVCTLWLVPQVDGGHLAAGLVYLGVIAVLCAIVALHVRAYQYREYVSREDLKRDYATDPLTGLGNRIRLEEETAKWLDRAEKYDLPLSLVVMDVDNMKKVNDTYGHVQGDIVLCQLAEVMRAELRRDDVCVRWGGDEFILLLPYTRTNDAEKLMRRMQRAISGHAFNPPVTLTFSFGIAPMQSGMNLTAMLAEADAMMYDAKRQGKNSRKTEIPTDTEHVC